MQVRPNLPFNLSLELAKLVMILVIYAPYAVMDRPMPAHRPGWRYRRGLWYWAMATAFVSFGPVLLGEPFNWHLLVEYVLPVLPACLFAYLFLRMLENMYEARESAERAKKTAALATIQLREYAEQIEQTAVLRERTRLARDVHDTIAHAFTNIHSQLEVLEQLIPAERAEAAAVLGQVKAQVSDSHDELRRSVHALQPLQVEERSEVDSIRKLVQDFAATTGVSADLLIEGDPLELPVAQALCLYRAIQEGLTNAFRHGRAQRARVRLLFAPGAVTASIEDDGVGAKESATTGFGLVGIRERSALVGGTVAAGTAATGGFVLRVTLPLAGSQPTAGSAGAQ